MANAERLTSLDSSAIVKLAVQEPESTALRRYLRRRQPYVTSALARTEVARALMPLGPEIVRRGMDVLVRVDLVRINDRILVAAATLMPAEVRSLDAIHIATAQQLGGKSPELFVAQVKQRRCGHTRISRKNQATLPVDALRKAGL